MTELMKLIDERIEHCFNTSSHNEGDYTAFDALVALKTALEALSFVGSYSLRTSLEVLDEPEEMNRRAQLVRATIQDRARQALTQIETQMKGEVGE